MLTYNSTLQNTPPITAGMQAQATAMPRSPFTAFGKNHQDVLRSLYSANAANLDLQAQKTNTDYELAQQQAQRQLALSGLQQMAEAQQNQNALANRRLQSLIGVASPLLQGLFN